MTSNDESLRKAYLPSQLALKYHPFYRGKIEIVPKCPIRSLDDFAIWYTPGVAEACESIRLGLKPSSRIRIDGTL